MHEHCTRLSICTIDATRLNDFNWPLFVQKQIQVGGRLTHWIQIPLNLTVSGESNWNSVFNFKQLNRANRSHEVEINMEKSLKKCIFQSLTDTAVLHCIWANWTEKVAYVVQSRHIWPIIVAQNCPQWWLLILINFDCNHKNCEMGRWARINQFDKFHNFNRHQNHFLFNRIPFTFTWLSITVQSSLVSRFVVDT